MTSEASRDFSVPVEPVDLPLPDLVVVLAGGLSHERDVSLRSGRRVADSLLEHGIEVELRDPDASLLGQIHGQGARRTRARRDTAIHHPAARRVPRARRRRGVRRDPR